MGDSLFFSGDNLPKKEPNVFRVLVSGSLWGMFAMIVAAAANFFSVPILISHYGKSDYGLIALTFSLNAYLRLMELGVTTGAIRYFSLWFRDNQTTKISNVAQSSIIFYGLIGVINIGLFLIIANNATSFFNLTFNQVHVFKWMMYILSISAIFNWTSNVVTQLLTSIGQIAWINKLNSINSISNLISAYTAVVLNLPLQTYFFLYTFTTLLIIPFNIYKLKATEIPLNKLLTPKWHFQDFKEVFKYSMAIFAMGIFQFSADYLRPILLGALSQSGTGVLSDFRILQTFGLLVTMLGGVFITVLLPYTTRLHAEGDLNKINSVITVGTKYISIFLSLFIFCIICNAKLLLLLYVGAEYTNLSNWLIIWLLTLLYMHNAPVSSFILSTGKTKFLVYLAGLSSIVCLVVTAILAKKYGVGAAVIGYASFIIIHLLGDYLYNIPKILQLRPLSIFKSFYPPVLAGLASWLIVYVSNSLWDRQLPIWQIMINSMLFVSVFISFTLKWIISLAEIKPLLKKLNFGF